MSNDAKMKLIRQLANCIDLLADEDDCYTAEYIIDRYLWEICTNSEDYKVEDNK